MKVIRGNQFLPTLGQQSIATIGNFDGLHQGHQSIIHHVIDDARRRQLSSIVITFEPTAKEYFLREQAPARLFTLREKLQHLKELGPDICVVLRFNQHLAQMPAEDFVKDILLTSLGIKKLYVGDDFKFGYQRQGDIHLLREMAANCHFEVTDTESIQLGHARISSTLIRDKLKQGLFTEASQLLTRPYAISGKVFHGDKKGRTIGFPTANILLHRQTLPLHGVFAVSAQSAHKQWNGVANVGHRPTVNGTRDQCEVHLFDCDEDLYGQRLNIRFYKKIREEQKFSGLDTLLEQIKIDVEQAKNYFSKG